MAKRSLIPQGGGTEGDIVMTPRPLAKAIIEHFKPVGRILDPCRGDGAFYDQFVRTESYHVIREWCEISEGRDFLGTNGGCGWIEPWARYDWICSNPPWSRLRAFNQRAMQLADNIVWLCTVNHFWLKARRRDMREAGFGIREILEVDTPTKETNWPQSGFQLGAVWIQRGWKGDVRLSKL